MKPIEGMVWNFMRDLKGSILGSYKKLTIIMLIIFIGIIMGLGNQIDGGDSTDFLVTEVYADEEGGSSFRTVNIQTSELQKLGYYSDKYDVKGLKFRKSIKGETFDFHTAPKKQYIVYLSGEAEIEVSSGQKKKFKAGDILLASDTEGIGHKSTITKNGLALILEVED